MDGSAEQRDVRAEEHGAASPPSTEPFSMALGQRDNVTSNPTRMLNRPPSNSPAPPSQGPSRTTPRTPTPHSLWIPQLGFYPLLLPSPPHPRALPKTPGEALDLRAPPGRADPSPPLP